MAAISASEHFVARNIFELWRLRRLPIARACAISKRASDPSPQNCTAWGCADLWQNLHWPTPMSYVIGAYGPLLIKRARKLYIDDDIGLDLVNTVYALDSTTIDLCFSLFRGRIFARPRRRSKCTR